MVSNKVRISESAQSDLLTLSSVNLGRFGTACVLLEEDEIREMTRVDLSIEEGGLPVWGLETDHLSIAYVEYRDYVEVVRVAPRSLFRPPRGPQTP